MRPRSTRTLRASAIVTALLLASCGLATLGTSSDFEANAPDGSVGVPEDSDAPLPEVDAAKGGDAAIDRAVEASADAEASSVDSGTTCGLVVTGPSVTITSGGAAFSATSSLGSADGTYVVVRGFNQRELRAAPHQPVRSSRPY